MAHRLTVLAAVVSCGLSLSSSSASAAPASAERALKTVSLKFVRTTVTAEGIETVKGEAFYRRPNRLHIEITDPVRQVLVVKDTSLLIYYPESSKAFQIVEGGPIKMPFIQSLLSMLRGRWGMAESGFQLTGEEKQGERTVSRWEPPAKMKPVLAGVTLTMEGGRLVGLEARDAAGRVAVKTAFSDHADLSGRLVPMHEHSELAQGTGSEIEVEDVTYSDVQIDVVLPDRVSAFRVPESVPVKTVRW